MIDETDAQIFVIGDDDFNQRRLRELERGRPWRFQRVLDYETSQDPSVPIRTKLERAVREMEEIGHVDAVCSYWDFPQMAMVSVIAERFGLPAPKLETLVRCQHKYYSRVEQAKVVPDLVPRFTAVNPFVDYLRDLELDPPFWLKPVRAHSSQLGFRVDDEADYERAIAAIQKRLHTFEGATNEVLRMSRLPESLAHVDGGWCLAEEIISGDACVQCTAEGFVPRDGEPVVYGVVDSYRYPGKSPFERYQYPSSLPAPVIERIRQGCATFMEHIDFRSGAFNVEFFWDEQTDRLSLLEVNARTSQSHADLFEWVDGTSNLETVARLSLGETPAGRHHDGEYDVAAKFFYRSFRDARVRRAPTPEEIDRIVADIPGVHVQIPPRGHDRLSDMLDQDSYSYELALVHAAAKSRDELEAKYRAVVERLSFDLEDPDTGERIDPREALEAVAS